MRLILIKYPGTSQVQLTDRLILFTSTGQAGNDSHHQQTDPPAHKNLKPDQQTHKVLPAKSGESIPEALLGCRHQRRPIRLLLQVDQRHQHVQRIRQGTEPGVFLTQAVAKVPIALAIKTRIGFLPGIYQAPGLAPIRSTQLSQIPTNQNNNCIGR